MGNQIQEAPSSNPKRFREREYFTLQKMLFPKRIKKLLGIGQIHFIKQKDGSIMFLEVTQYDSIHSLRKLFEPDYFDAKKEKYKEIWDIIHKNYLEGCRATKKTAKKKQKYYAQMRIDARKNKIKRLQEELRQLRGIK
jgi:hypothetical protein